MTTSVVRTVLLVVAAVSYLVSLTPPTSATAADERRTDKFTSISSLQRGSFIAPLVSKALVASIALVEVAVTYATTRPIDWASGYILAATGSDRLGPSDIFVSPNFVVGVFLACVGGCIRVVCYHTLGRHFTFRLALRDKHKLVTSGPYAIVRHPSYTGLALLLAGLTMCELSAGSWWAAAAVSRTIAGKVIAAIWIFFLMYGGMIIRRAEQEDVILCGMFGEKWVRYAVRVPCKFVPGVV